MPKRQISTRKLRKNSIGDLRDVISLETRQMLAPSFGSSSLSQNYTQVIQTWAKVETLDHGRIFNQVALDPKTSHRFTIRHRDDITTETRIRHNDILYRISKMDNPESRNEYFIIYASVEGADDLEANQ